MDKALFKRMCRGLGLPIIDWREIRAERWAADAPGVRAELTAFAAGAADPRLMVKPSRLGSSVGMTLVHDIGELTPALDLAFRYDTVALVESYLAGARDLEISIIGNDPARLELYGPGEIVSGHEFYDYAAKYTPGLSETSTQAEVPSAIRVAMHKLARDAYRGIGAEGFARMDFLVVRGRGLPLRDQHHPGLHADQPLPDAAGRRRLHVRRGLRADRRTRHRTPRRPGRHRLAPGRPAAMSSRPSARRSVRPGPPRPVGPSRVGRVCRGSGPGRPSRCSWPRPASTASVRRRRSTSPTSP